MRPMYSFIGFSFMFFMIVGCSTFLEDNIQSKQQVLVESIPTKSEIFINGKLVGETPIILTLKSDISHVIYFEKKGFKPTTEYLDPICKNEKKPYVQFGLVKDLGFYSKLSKSHVVAELDWEHLPNSIGIRPYETMSSLIAKADKELYSENLTQAEHKTIIGQIIKVFNLE